ncbi:MAG: hypothetical protein Kow00127_12910 [Bacteroidales bacterium]
MNYYEKLHRILNRIWLLLLLTILANGESLAAILPPPEPGGWQAEDVYDSGRNKIDSLLVLLPQASLEHRVDILYNLARIYLAISMDSAHEYARLALQSAKELNDPKKIAEAYKLLGNIHLYQGDYRQVLNLYDSSLREFTKANDSFGLSRIWNNLGIIYHNLGDYEQALNFHLKSLESKIELGDSTGIANSYNNIGSIYLDLEEYSRSYDYFLRALEISEALGQKSTVASILNNLGVISQEVGDQEKAIDYFLRSLKIGQEAGAHRGIGDNYHNLGKSYYLMGNYLKALEYYNKAIEVYELLGVSTSNTLNNIAQTYIDLEEYDKALSYLNLALRNALENGQLRIVRDCYYNFSTVYALKGWYRNAYESYQSFHMYDDSLSDMLHSSKIEEITAKNELEKQREEYEKTQILLEKKEAQLQRRNLIFYGSLLLLAILFVFMVIVLRLLRLRTLTNRKLKTQNEEIRRSQEIISKINQALTESEGKLRSVFDISPIGLLLLDKELKIVDCNSTSLKFLNAPDKNELINRSVTTLFAPQESGKRADDYAAMIRKAGMNCEQAEIIRFDRTTFPAEISSRKIQSEMVPSTIYIVVIQDISERKRIINDLKEASQKAVEADKLKTAFLANMSHEIRTPMNSIVGFANLLNDDNLPRDKQKEYIQHILKGSQVLMNLIEDIIDISKIEAGQIKFNVTEFGLNQVLNESFESFSEVIRKKGVELRIRLPENSGNVRCKTDPNRLKQVIFNLISNALKFTQKGYVELGYRIRRNGGRPMAEIYVKDTGIGIPKDKQELIFERFRQVDDSRTRSYGGTGLGLAISKKLVELMGGVIRVESEPEVGSEFIFTVPVLTDKLPEQEAEPNQEPLQDKSEIKILVAEDEDSNYALLRATLHPEGFHLIRKENGVEAVEYVRQGNPVDLVLMDIRMPRMNGYEATKHIKEIRPDLPVIAVTAFAMSEDFEKSRKAGCDAYISKPVEAEKLKNLISELLRNTNGGNNR